MFSCLIIVYTSGYRACNLWPFSIKALSTSSCCSFSSPRDFYIYAIWVSSNWCRCFPFSCSLRCFWTFLCFLLKFLQKLGYLNFLNNYIVVSWSGVDRTVTKLLIILFGKWEIPFRSVYFHFDHSPKEKYFCKCAHDFPRATQ